jgi:hypothetical protein
MQSVGSKHRIGIAPLKAVFAILFLLMFAIQPGLFASAKATGLHGDAGTTVTEDAVQDFGGHVDEQHSINSDASHGPKKSGETCCEVQCGPAQAVPAKYQVFGDARARCFAISSVAVLPLGEYAELNRPPRHLS